MITLKKILSAKEYAFENGIASLSSANPKDRKDLRREGRKLLTMCGITPPEPWKGVKEILHAWHEPELTYFLKYEDYLERAIEIVYCKPEEELLIRMRSMRPVWWKWQRTKVRASLEKRARLSVDVAFEYKRWKSSDWMYIRRLHSIHCKKCTWDWESMMMTFEE